VSFSPFDHILNSSYSLFKTFLGGHDVRYAGLDIAEHILARLDGKELFKKYVVFLIQVAHFDNEYSLAYSHAEIAVAAVLVASDIFAASPRDLIPTAWLTERAAQSSEILQIIAERYQRLGTGRAEPSSPANVDAEGLY
jgi:hypothetical protein